MQAREFTVSIDRSEETSRALSIELRAARRVYEGNQTGE
jgi:hypothetical protein